MATIARRYQKKYNLLPRGKALYEDQDRFGTRMLKKMGWTEGKGLGANEDGSEEFVRVKYKNDSTGFGFEERDDQWTHHEESFSGLLKSLNNKNDVNNTDSVNNEIEISCTDINSESSDKCFKNKISGESLEEKSKTSKVRVHYKKFTRGKDVSRYSEKDLANIFGKKFDESAAITEDKSQNEVKSQNFEIENVLNEYSDCEHSKKSNSPILGNEKNKIQDEHVFLIPADEKHSKLSRKKSKKRKRDTELPDVDEDNIEKIEFSDRKTKDISDKSLEDSSNFKEKNEIQQQNNEIDEMNSEQSVHYTKSKILEVFRHLDLDRFKGSNIKDIPGYGFTENFVIKLKKSSDDSKQITDVWIKAKEREKRFKYVKSEQKEVIEKMKKQKRQIIKKKKRKNLFQAI